MRRHIKAAEPKRISLCTTSLFEVFLPSSVTLHAVTSCSNHIRLQQFQYRLDLNLEESCFELDKPLPRRSIRILESPDFIRHYGVGTSF
jgi:hypothetical protein